MSIGNGENHKKIQEEAKEEEEGEEFWEKLKEGEMSRLPPLHLDFFDTVCVCCCLGALVEAWEIFTCVFLRTSNIPCMQR